MKKSRKIDTEGYFKAIQWKKKNVRKEWTEKKRKQKLAHGNKEIDERMQRKNIEMKPETISKLEVESEDIMKENEGKELAHEKS